MMLLEMAASTYGERVAFTNVTDDTSLTYQQLFDHSGRVAAGASGAGFDHFATLDVSSVAIPIMLFASGWAGVPFVPLNYRLSQAEIDALFARITPAYLVTDAATVAGGVGSGLECVSREEFLGALTTVDVGDAGEWSMDPEEVAVLLFTSGTTGEPKAAVLRHKHLVSYILSSVEFASATPDETALVCVPPYHIAGIMAVLSSVYSGRRVVQLPDFTPAEWIEVARREEVTSAFVVPTMLARIVETLDGQSSANLPALASLSYGGGRMPLQVLERAVELFPDTDFSNAYGLTETSSTIAVFGPEEHREAAASSDPQIHRRLVSVGRPLPGIEIEVRDDEGRVVSADEAGEIYVRGEQVSGEYRGLGSLVDEAGWFATRDTGFLDREGYLFLSGRADDVIVRGGENMSPGEIEAVLLAHPSVEDAAVVGIPDVQWGESVAAVVVVRSGMSVSADELRGWVRERLRSSRVPQLINFREELPYNPTGKLLRRVIKAELATTKES